MLTLEELFESDAPEDDEAGGDVDERKGAVEFEKAAGSIRNYRSEH